MDIIGVPMGAVLRFCYQLIQNYGLALILFTLITKIILFPVSMWVHINGIKMVRIQPAINRLKIKFFGDKDAIADEQTKLYKKEKYNPFLGIVPIVVQLILLIGLIQVIYHPLSYVLRLPDDLIRGIIQVAGDTMGVDIASASIELMALDGIQKASSPDAYMAISGMTDGIYATIQNLNMNFLGFNLAGVPITDGGILLLLPFLAGLASVVLSLSQNRLNPLQAEQGKIEKLVTMLFSVGISLVVGFTIPAGVGFYWIWSNLFTIVQQLLLNRTYKPERHIDYAELEASKAELENYQDVGKTSGKRPKEEVKREREDYKRFFSILNKHLVFYSESNGFYKYFQGVIEYLVKYTNIVIHYVTSDPNDKIFDRAKDNESIKAYYIGEKKLITLMMRLEADIVVMTMPDLEHYHIKRSYMRKDIEYIYVFHGLLVGLRTLRKGALDCYDTVFCSGPRQEKEIRETEALTNTTPKKLVQTGYSLIDILAKQYEETLRDEQAAPYVLIAPSWQEDNIFESVLHDVVSPLIDAGYQIIVRPHPQYITRFATRYGSIVDSCKKYPSTSFRIDSDFSSNSIVYHADLVITDWSSIGFEFALATLKPTLFINTPIKIVNQDMAVAVSSHQPPFDIALRDIVGRSMEMSSVSAEIVRVVRELIKNRRSYAEIIQKIRRDEIYNFGHSAEHEGQYIIKALQEKVERKKSQ